MIHRHLAATAFVFAAIAAVLGNPRPPGLLAPDGLQAIAGQEGRVHVVELARWIRDQKEGLRVLDLRSQTAFDDFHIPTAKRMDLATMITQVEGAEGTVVVYDDTGYRAAQVWLLLRGRVAGDIRYLDGGAAAWISGLMTAELPGDATSEELLAWPEASELSRYFGGLPRVGDSRTDAAPPPWLDAGRGGDQIAALVSSARRQGCGF